MTQKRISIVIPVYNEQDALAACLMAIVRLRVQPFEVLVVDNNSTDESRQIAAQFPFVRLLSEPRQGVTYARNRGFNAARGDIIARIDADTRLPANWTERLLAIFAEEATDAVSGSLHYYDIGLAKVIDRIDLGIRRWLSNRMPERRFLLGANMAIRRSAWQTVRRDVCIGKHLHEDLDLAVHMAECDQTVIFDEALLAGVSARRADTRFGEFMRYAHLSPQTYAIHQAPESKYMYPVIGFVAINYLLLRMLLRGFDAGSGRFRWRMVLAPGSAARVNPATFSQQG